MINSSCLFFFSPPRDLSEIYIYNKEPTTPTNIFLVMSQSYIQHNINKHKKATYITPLPSQLSVPMFKHSHQMKIKMLAKLK